MPKKYLNVSLKFFSNDYLLLQRFMNSNTTKVAKTTTSISRKAHKNHVHCSVVIKKKMKESENSRILRNL